MEKKTKRFYPAINLMLLWALGIWGCTSDATYEAYITFENQAWYADSVARFDFTIENTSVPYRLDYYIRNSLEYPYYNLYVQYELLDSDGRILRTSLEENNLMHPQSGKPFGEGSGSVFDHTFPLMQSYSFEKTGAYQLVLKQYMRLDTLGGIHAVGFRIAPLETAK